jgi:hypothetical protein
MFQEIPNFPALSELFDMEKTVRRKVMTTHGARVFQMDIAPSNRKKIQDLFEKLSLQCKSYECASISMAERVHDLGLSIEKAVASESSELSSDLFYQMLTSIHKQLIRIKILLHIDGALTSVYALMEKRLEAFKSFGYKSEPAEAQSSLAEQAVARAIDAMPQLLSLITLDEHDCSFQVNISEITKGFNSFDYDKTGSEFDLAMLDIASLFAFDKELGIITTNRMIPKEMVKQMMLSQNPSVEQIGQLLFVCYICQHEVFEEDLNYMMAQPFLLQLCPLHLHSGRYLFPTTSKDHINSIATPMTALPWAAGKEQGSAPFLRKMIIKRDMYAAAKKPFITILLSPADCAEFTGYTQEIACSYYDLILRIESAVGKFLPPYLKPQGEKDLCIKGLIDHLTPLVIESGLITNWQMVAVDANGFCPSVSSFSHMIGNFFGFKKIAPAATLTPNALPKAKKKGSVKARQLQRLSTLEGMGSCSTLTESVIELETSVPRPDPITLSLETTKKIRAQLTIAKRVGVWFHSDRKVGLRQRGMGHDPVAKQDKMVSTHRFPEDILILALDPHFSKKIPWTENPQHTVYQSCIFIDGKKHVLEATVDPQSVLYHLCAKPIAKWQDYFLTSSDFPTLSQQIEESLAGPKALSTTQLCWSKEGNAQFTFEDKTYELIQLYTPY